MESFLAVPEVRPPISINLGASAKKCRNNRLYGAECVAAEFQDEDGLTLCYIKILTNPFKSNTTLVGYYFLV